MRRRLPCSRGTALARISPGGRSQRRMQDIMSRSERPDVHRRRVATARFPKLVRRVTATLRAVPDNPVVLASVSGGADSTFLLHLLRAVAERLPLQLHVMHVDHGLRRDSQEDAQFVAALAQQWDLPFHGHRLSFPTTGSVPSGSFSQQSLRAARYRVLSERALALAPAPQIPIIATGHHARDNAETILMNLARGCHLGGLRGIDEWQTLPAPLFAAASSPAPPRRIHLYRPLRHWDRPAIEDALRAGGQAWREDPSNQKQAYFRNRIRHQVLPALAERNAKYIEMLAHRTQSIRDEFEGVMAYHAENLDRLNLRPAWERAGVFRTVRTNAVLFDQDRFRALPAWKRHGLLNAFLRRCLLAARNGLNGDLITSERIRAWAQDLCAVRRTTRSVQVFKGGQWACWRRPNPLFFPTRPPANLISVTAGADADAHFDLNAPQLPCAGQWRPDPFRAEVLPQRVFLPYGPGLKGWVLQMQAMPAAFTRDKAHAQRLPWTAYADKAAWDTAGLCRLRPATAEDRMQPWGMAGRSKKMRRMLADKSLPPEAQGAWPALFAGDGRPIWLCGLHLDQRFALTPATRQIVQLQCLPVGDSET